MSDSALIFAGPSLKPYDRAQFSQLTFLPPVARGDILRVLPNRPAAIGIIDGYFGDRPAVVHKEILEALASGIAVYGAASMGALRASELETYGMTGVGKIFRDYRNGVLTSDASVAMSHGPQELDYPPLSISEVDVAATLRALTARGHLTRQEAADIELASDRLHYSDRTWTQIANAVNNAPASALRLGNLLTAAHVEAKRLDAIEMLRVVERRRQPYPPAENPAIFPPLTPSYQRLRKDILKSYCVVQ